MQPFGFMVGGGLPATPVATSRARSCTVCQPMARPSTMVLQLLSPPLLLPAPLALLLWNVQFTFCFRHSPLFNLSC